MNSYSLEFDLGFTYVIKSVFFDEVVRQRDLKYVSHCIFFRFVPFISVKLPNPSANFNIFNYIDH